MRNYIWTEFKLKLASYLAKKQAFPKFFYDGGKTAQNDWIIETAELANWKHGKWNICSYLESQSCLKERTRPLSSVFFLVTNPTVVEVMLGLFLQGL